MLSGRKGSLLSCMLGPSQHVFFFFFNDTATTEIYTLSLHDALPISGGAAGASAGAAGGAPGAGAAGLAPGAGAAGLAPGAGAGAAPGAGTPPAGEPAAG